jgi:multidrug efflux pump subunit AcrA (membrane-fusion protein)
LFSIPQTEAADVALGDRFSLNPPNSGAGRISALSPMVDAATNSRAAEGVLSRGGDGLVPGSFATISLMTGAAIPAFAVPATALNDSLLGRYVFVVHAQASGDVLRTVYVSQLASQGNNAVIAAADLKAGDEVVAIGGFKLTDGEAVKIAP